MSADRAYDTIFFVMQKNKSSKVQEKAAEIKAQQARKGKSEAEVRRLHLHRRGEEDDFERGGNQITVTDSLLAVLVGETAAQEGGCQGEREEDQGRRGCSTEGPDGAL